jgi:hypothetical protein
MEEIPLFLMDPKSSMLQYFIQGIDGNTSAAELFAGTYNERPAIFMDTWDAGGLAYIALGTDKTKEFVLDTLIKFGKVSNAANLIIFAKPEYGRSEEFCNFMRRDGFLASEIDFKSIDVENSVLRKYSSGKKCHYTDAYKWNNMQGKIEAFSIEL